MVNLNDVLFQMLLEDLFERYGSMLSIHQLFIPELVLLLRRGGIEQQFMSRLSDNLAKLRDYGDVCIRKKKSNMEYLVGQSPLCSMRFLLPGSNIRVLFVYQNEKMCIRDRLCQQPDLLAVKQAARCLVVDIATNQGIREGECAQL